jgi:hypothetical protein
MCMICNASTPTHIYTTSTARGFKGRVCEPCGSQCVREDTNNGHKAKITPIK